MLAATLVVMLLAVSPAFAFDETTSTMDFAGCQKCHTSGTFSFQQYEVHSGYTATSKKCTTCHSVHAASATGSRLLPAATITADCNVCHDGTGGQGVYGALKARLGAGTVVYGHRTETTTVVPGGNSATGGNSTMAFSGLGGTLTCTDCHSPHGADTVNRFKLDRLRTSFGSTTPADFYPTGSSVLLKRHPGGSATAVNDYGSDWCLACHKGRVSGAAVHNHPADSIATAATPFTFNNAAILSTETTVTGTTILGSLGWTNAGYLMPYPRTAQQAGHAPICEQCHADPRYAGSMDSSTGKAQAGPHKVTVPSYGSPDGRIASDNPRFQVFPHESTATAMLIEQNDDLCMNCHPTGQLP